MYVPKIFTQHEMTWYIRLGLMITWIIDSETGNIGINVCGSTYENGCVVDGMLCMAVYY